MAYSKKVVEKFESTLNEPEKNSVGRWNPSDSDIGTGMVGAPACGDVMRLQIKCEPKNNSHIISDVKFKTYGCGSAIASSSELVDMLIGKLLKRQKRSKTKILLMPLIYLLLKSIVRSWPKTVSIRLLRITNLRFKHVI